MLRLRHSGVVAVHPRRRSPVGAVEHLRAARAEVDAVSVSDAVIGYVAAVVRRTREVPSVALGASPRAAVHLLAAAKAAACLWGRAYVVPDDVVNVAGPVLAPPAGAHARGGTRPLPARRRAAHRPVQRARSHAEAGRLPSRCVRGVSTPTPC